jgi:hypothetical protein
MTSVLISLLTTVRGVLRSRAALHLEVLALRHQVQVLQRSQSRRLQLANADRWLWRGCHTCGTAGERPSSLCSQRPSSPGIARDSAVLDAEESATHGPAGGVRRCAGADPKDGA